MSSNNLREFAEYVRAAPTDHQAEQIVRSMIGEVAKSCPMIVLVELSKCVISCRRDELRGDAERN